MNLSTLRPAQGTTARKRIGRGSGSGLGGTSTRGHKGAKSRSGYSRKFGFEGGQMPLQRRLPKFGFKNPNRVEYTPVNLDAIVRMLENNPAEKITVADFVAAGLAHKDARIKVLGNGELNSKVAVEAHAFSKSAEEAIKNAGGEATKVQ